MWGRPVVCPWQELAPPPQTWFLAAQAILSNFFIYERIWIYFTQMLFFGIYGCFMPSWVLNFFLLSFFFTCNFFSTEHGWSKAPHKVTKHSSFSFRFPGSLLWAWTSFCRVSGLALWCLVSTAQYLSASFLRMSFDTTTMLLTWPLWVLQLTTTK